MDDDIDSFVVVAASEVETFPDFRCMNLIPRVAPDSFVMVEVPVVFTSTIFQIVLF